MFEKSCKHIRDHKYFEIFIITVILFAGLLVGLETSLTFVRQYGTWLKILDKMVLYIFVLEAFIKILAEGKKPWRYFQKGWNIFDFTIVAICFLPFNAQYVTVLRLARVLRVFRLATVIPRLQVLVAGIIKSIPSMFYVSALLFILFYIYAVLGIFLFRGNDPGHFGDLGTSLTSLFRLVTLDNWTDLLYTAYYGSDVYNALGLIPVGPEPRAFGVWGIIYFVSFVIIGALVMVNLFIGIVLTNLTEAQAEVLREKLHLPDVDEDSAIQGSLERIEKELIELRQRLGTVMAKGKNQ